MPHKMKIQNSVDIYNDSEPIRNDSYQLRKHMVVATVLYEPSVTECGFNLNTLNPIRAQNCSRPGLDHEILGAVAFLVVR